MGAAAAPTPATGLAMVRKPVTEAELIRESTQQIRKLNRRMRRQAERAARKAGTVIVCSTCGQGAVKAPGIGTNYIATTTEKGERAYVHADPRACALFQAVADANAAQEKPETPSPIVPIRTTLEHLKGKLIPHR